MSILILYLRLFAVNRTFRYLTWLTMFFVCGYLFANLWTQIFGCSPRSKYWDPDTPGHCINYTKAGLAYGSMNILSDLLIFTLPLPIIWRLELSRNQKIGVSLIFMSGAVYADNHPNISMTKVTILTVCTELVPWQLCDMLISWEKIQLTQNTLYGGLS